MSKPLKQIDELKQKLNELLGISQREFFPAPGVEAGIPKGVLVEVTGTRKTEWLLQVLLANPSFQAFWMEQKQTLLPTAMEQRGVGLERVTFAIAQEPYLSLRRAIQSQIFEMVVCPYVFDELRTLKALQLLCEKANTTLFLCARKTAPAWPISVQIQATQNEVLVLKYKQKGIL